MTAPPATALSVRQPWAWAIIHAGKDIENRSEGSVRSMRRPRGRIAIHAAKGMTRAEYEDARDFMGSIGVACPWPDELVRGAIIGSVDVRAIASASTSPWFFGPLGLVMVDPAEIDPIPAAGALGVFHWREGGEIDPARPWMTSWPEAPQPRRQGAAKQEALL